MKTISVINFTPGLQNHLKELRTEFVNLLDYHAAKTSWCLDLGTGDGKIPFYLSEKVRWILGIDAKSSSIENARKYAQNNGVTNVQFIVGDLEKVDYADLAPTGLFQLVTTNLCISDEIIQRIPQCLDQNGIFIGTCYETHHWRETGYVVDNSYMLDELMFILKALGLEILFMDVIGSIVQFENLEQLENDYLPRETIDSWKKGPHWENISKEFDRGNKNLTDSRIVFCAKK